MLIPGMWITRGLEFGQVSEWASWDAAYRYAKTCADNHWTKVAAAEARLEREAADLDDIIGFDGAVWVGSREFKVPAAWRGC